MLFHNLVSFIKLECIFNTRSVLGIQSCTGSREFQAAGFSVNKLCFLRILSKYIRRSIRSSLAFPLPLYQASRAKICIIKQRSSILRGKKPN